MEDTEKVVPTEKTQKTKADKAEKTDKNDRNERADKGDKGDRNAKGGAKFIKRKKVCNFCVDRIENIDYKDAARLRKFISERAKILPRRITGTCTRHQRDLTTAIKRARHIALLPYTNE